LLIIVIAIAGLALAMMPPRAQSSASSGLIGKSSFKAQSLDPLRPSRLIRAEKASPVDARPHDVDRRDDGERGRGSML
jgi:hypothetical protein